MKSSSTFWAGFPCDRGLTPVPEIPVANLDFFCYCNEVFRLKGGSRSMITKIFSISNLRAYMAGPARTKRWSHQ